MKKPVKRVDQAKIRLRKNIAFRMNLLFFSIFILFSLLILRLGYLQIVKGEETRLRLEKTEESAVNTSVARGRIYDRVGRILVDNDPKNAITYTKLTTTTSREMLDIAEKLADLIEQDTGRITKGDKRDFWILLNSEEAFAKTTAEERKAIESDRTLTRSDIQREINRLTRERITEEEINSFSDRELEVLAIYREMMSGYALTPQIVKSGTVTDEEFAAVSERLNDLPGVNTTTDWERVRKSYYTILGTTTSPTEGIPRTHLDYFLSRDYSRNDRVGRSFIEQYYEELLHGQKTIVKNIKDRSGRVIETKTVKEGEPGKDLVLTIDSELQEELEQILSDKLIELKTEEPNTEALDRAFLIMMDPNNGEILSLVGKQVVKNKETGQYEIRDYAFGTFTDTFEMGSTVKPATLLTGYHYGGARIGETKIDEPIVIKDTAPKTSIFNRNSRMNMTDIEAIGRSSNVYMFKTAIAIGEGVYRPGESLVTKSAAFDIFRDSFASFGLGIKTGIDLPGEAVGLPGTVRDSGLLLNYSIGQYDTYTPIQLAQFVSTIANGGYRIAPKILKEIREPSMDGVYLGPLVQETNVNILNRIMNTDEEINRVKQGMYFTYYGNTGTARSIFTDVDFDAGGKTGTAQSGVTIDGTYYKTINLSHVGFTPFENPELTYVVVIPHISTDQGKYPPEHNRIIEAAVKKYYELKKKNNALEHDFEVQQKIQEPLEQDSE